MDALSLPVILPALITAAGGIAVARITIRARRHETDAAKAPTVEQLWAQQAEDARARRRAEALLDELVRVFLRYADRVSTGGPNDLTDDERHTIDAAQGALK